MRLHDLAITSCRFTDLLCVVSYKTILHLGQTRCGGTTLKNIKESFTFSKRNLLRNA